MSHEIGGCDEVDQFTELVVFGFPVGLQAADGGLVGEAEGATEGVGE